MITAESRIALVATIAAVGVLGAGGAAHAVTVKGTTTEVMAHINAPKKDLDLRFRSSGNVSVVPVIDSGDLVAHVTAGATGEGATQEECDSHARLINTRAHQIIAILIGLRSEHRDYESARAATIEMVDEIEETLDDGCSTVYRDGPPPEDEPEIG